MTGWKFRFYRQNESPQLTEIPLKGDMCPVQPSSVLNVSYVEPDAVLVSWSTNPCSSFEQEQVLLSLYKMDAVMEEPIQISQMLVEVELKVRLSAKFFYHLILISQVSGTCQVLTGVALNGTYVLEISGGEMTGRPNRCCAVLCPQSPSVLAKAKQSLSNAKKWLRYVFYTENEGKVEKNQITGLRSSVFYPLRGNDSIVTAQVLWETMDPQPDRYQVRVLSTSIPTGCRVTVSA